MDIISSVSNTIYYSGKQLKLRLRQGNGNKTANLDIYRVANKYLNLNKDIAGDVLLGVTEYEMKNYSKWNQAQSLLKRIKQVIDLDDIRKFVEAEVKVPVMINDKFDPSKIYGTAGSEDQTFITAEYLDTITVSVAVQITLPILVTAVNTMVLTRSPNLIFIQLGNMAEYLFGKYIKKLILFITTISEKVNGKRHNRVIRLNDVPEEDLPNFILGNILLLRMPSLRYENEDPTVRPTNAWPINSFKRAIENTMRIGMVGNSSINEKTPPVEQDGVTKMSSLDNSGISTLVAIDQVVAAMVYLESMVIYEHMNIPKSIYHDELYTTFLINTTEIPDFNIEIIKLVTFYTFPYGLISHMEQKHMAIIQTVVVEWLLHNKLIDLTYIICSREGASHHSLGAYRSVEETKFLRGGINDYLKDLINMIKHDSVYILDDATILIQNNFKDNVSKASLAKELSKLLKILDK